MAEKSDESGLRWWLRYVIVPLLGGGGVIAILVSAHFQINKHADPVASPSSSASHPELVHTAPAQSSSPTQSSSPSNSVEPAPMQAPIPTDATQMSDTVACTFHFSRDSGAKKESFNLKLHPGSIKVNLSDGSDGISAVQQDDRAVQLKRGSTHSLEIEIDYYPQDTPGHFLGPRSVYRSTSNITVTDPCAYAANVANGEVSLASMGR